MISYELSKKLRDAGFPFSEQDLSVLYATDGYTPAVGPTLEELIEACGDKFHKLELNSSTEGETKWSAYEFRMSDEWKDGEYHYVFGSTPRIAVANLWLKLNSK